MSVKRVIALANPMRVGRFAHHVWSSAREQARESNVSVARVAAEQVGLYVANDLRRHEYSMYSLHRPNLTWEEKKAFVSDCQANDWWAVFTPRRYWGLFDNKIAFKQVYGSAGLPMAKTLAVFHPHWGRTENGKPLCTTEDLRRWVQSSGVQEFVMKPIEGTEGQSVYVLRRDPNDAAEGFISAPGEKYSLAELVRIMIRAGEENARNMESRERRSLDEFIFEERLSPLESMRHLVGETIACIRFVTLCPLDGPPEIVRAAFKLPTTNAGVDNIFHGALAVHVDAETGRLGEASPKRNYGGKLTSIHPVTGFDFFGYQLPMWQEARAIALRAAEVFPLARTAGWDIGLTTRGPMIIEGNVSCGVDLMQIASKQGLNQGRTKETYDRLVAMRAARGGKG